MRKHIPAALLLATISLQAASIPQVSSPEDVGLSRDRLTRIREAVDRHIESQQIAGAVTLVARKGRIAHFEAHGRMDREANKPMAKDAIFRIWSMSKPVAAIAILMLIEEGKVRLNDPASKFIPEFKSLKVAVAQAAVQEGMPSFYTIPATREITVQDLLTHVSGLGSGPASRSETQRIPADARRSLASFIPRLSATPLDFQPGSRWTYSPAAAFDTLGRIVEVASGHTFDRFLRDRLFAPLEMKDTFFYPGESHWPRIVTAYHRDGGTLKKTENPNRLVSETYFSGGGGLLSTAEDYAQLAGMLANGGQLNGKRYLGVKTVELMSSVFVPETFQGRKTGEGFGLGVRVITDPIAVGHWVSTGSYGWDGAYGTHFWIDPKEKLTGILMIQTDNPNRQLDRDFEAAVMQSIVE